MGLDDLVDYSLDPTTEGIFHYSLGRDSLGNKTLWGGEFLLDSLLNDMDVSFSPSSLFTDLPPMLPPELVLRPVVVDDLNLVEIVHNKGDNDHTK